MSQHPLTELFMLAIITATSWLSPAAADTTMPTTDTAEQRGQALWNEIFTIDGEQRSCVTCHGSNPSHAGKHVRTGKPIEPMATAVNPTRFSDPAKTEKWFRRNCRWTMGRLCSESEKQDILSYLKSHPGGLQ
jgi:mono/diheme cytochrome c family protein